MELTALKGIGEKTAGALSRLGIFCAEDLLFFYPREYETYEAPKSYYELTPGKTETVEGVLTREASVSRFGGMTVVNADLQDMTGRLRLSWYNLPYVRNALKTGCRYIFRGRVLERNGRLQMAQPKLYSPEEYQERFEGRLLPVYPLTKGLTNSQMVKAVAEALKTVPEAAEAEYLEETVRVRAELAEEKEALIRIHFPRSRTELAAARRRIVFDEFFLFLLAGALLREKTRRSASVYRTKPDFRMLSFIADLPWELTKGQQDAYKAIAHDLSSGRVMNRLIEGDVGSGKTIVAVLAMISVCLSGWQAAMMAPTEVLAAQHYGTVTDLLKDSGLGLRVLLLTGSMTAAEKKEAYEKIRTHEADIIIGTHALFQEKVEYAKLALVITDEQHRFGVAQREALSGKGEQPHTLVMSATPIPRTLAVILYGDLDISEIAVLPSGRLPIRNCVVGTGYRQKAWKFIYDEVKKGRQVYIICPAIENEDAENGADGPGGENGGSGAGGAGGTGAAEKAALQNVTDYTEELKRQFPPEIRIAALHGRMKPGEKDRIMTAMKEGETDILVSTTVVEVGVDVPNASVMMIENADRFGLAQLHQLRGRVGRGSEQSYCIMINASETEKAAERLSILNSSNDGFHIAEEDLRLRGPGDIFGDRQSGELLFHLADIYTDAEILKLAKSAVTAVLEEDPLLTAPEHAELAARLDKYLKNGYTV